MNDIGGFDCIFCKLLHKSNVNVFWMQNSHIRVSNHRSIIMWVFAFSASIAAEMAEAPFHSEHYYALFATGIVLSEFKRSLSV